MELKLANTSFKSFRIPLLVPNHPYGVETLEVVDTERPYMSVLNHPCGVVELK
ncbi:hypothetical protein BCF55_0975 [Hydrogenivirga caldilitoris]|uniref:Uncharacterized protein n=1 Tax=Hydrogenivirga caldilitoris TaxID=246264 RepID=A0A497XR09_9AQUI|nr:hypothetical protein BCF55_0975 [Hydrogenivirga caldilitoris]